MADDPYELITVKARRTRWEVCGTSIWLAPSRVCSELVTGKIMTATALSMTVKQKRV